MAKKKPPTYTTAKVIGGNRFLLQIDPAHTHADVMSQELVQEVWADKYRWGDEQNTEQTLERVAHAIYANDPEYMQEAFEAMTAGLWMPAGRIIAGAGTTKRVTLMNCYTNKLMEDSLDDIMDGCRIAAVTLQQGGGIGTDFSPLRPTGAILQRTGSKASGPLPFMDMWHAMSDTIMSAGHRRGAMMGTLCDTHPDLLQFITAKQTKGRLTNFNISILVSDALMSAVKDDEDWVLHFPVQPTFDRDVTLTCADFEDDDGIYQFVYSVHKARDLWDLITRNTYDWSEPGVIFIDRINELNNLKYCETIRCTNPCGEQPLPPNGTCNLGAINLARLVKNPFTPQAEMNWELLRQLARIDTRFLDNVIDITNYPLKEQEYEELNKRRLGGGVSGLADALTQLNVRYGSAQAVQLTEKIHQTICLESYETSVELAKERGAFPLFDRDQFLEGFAGRMLPEELKDKIRTHGIRNGVLLTVAPTGTTSILYGNISSGIEPNFSHKVTRKVRKPDGSIKIYEAQSYVTMLYKAVTGFDPKGLRDFPNSFVTSEDLTIEDHIVMQAAAQRWTDASISKTINVPETTTYEEFRKVYDLAYTLGCKGCTTYRPSEIRGSILSRAKEEPRNIGEGVSKSLAQRPEVLQGITHKVKWPSMSSALYITVNRDEQGQPFEIFFNTKDSRSHEWMVGLSLMISAILRKGGDVSFIGDELNSVHSVHDTAFIKIAGEEKSRFFGSLIAYVGYILSKDLQPQLVPPNNNTTQLKGPQPKATWERCPQCLAPNTLIHQEGCSTCTNCSYSSC